MLNDFTNLLNIGIIWLMMISLGKEFYFNWLCFWKNWRECCIVKAREFNISVTMCDSAYFGSTYEYDLSRYQFELSNCTSTYLI